MKRSSGFTVIELIVVILFLGIAALILLNQHNNLSAARRDNQRKTAINAMYYDLEEVYYKQNSYYPTTIDSQTLDAMDPALFTDPNGIKFGDPGSDYHYNATDCTDNKCQNYTLRATLEKEATYIKTNRSQSD